MTSSALRRARILVPAVELVVISVVLLPWQNAIGSDGPRDGESRSWNLLGGPLLPPPASMLVWLSAQTVASLDARARLPPPPMTSAADART